jgi:hypothetical protein
MHTREIDPPYACNIVEADINYHRARISSSQFGREAGNRKPSIARNVRRFTWGGSKFNAKHGSEISAILQLID